MKFGNPLRNSPRVFHFWLPRFVSSTVVHGFAIRGTSQPTTLSYGSPLQGTRSLTFFAKDWACSLVRRFSFGCDIHSRIIFRRSSCSGLTGVSFQNDLSYLSRHFA